MVQWLQNENRHETDRGINEYARMDKGRKIPVSGRFLMNNPGRFARQDIDGSASDARGMLLAFGALRRIMNMDSGCRVASGS